MFSVFCDVMALLQSYEKGLFSFIEVDFATTGLYYDATMGPNWWEYYFYPIKNGIKTQTPQHVIGLRKGIDPWEIELRTSKEEVYELIQKHIVIKQTIQDEIDAFTNHHFRDHFVIGVHYRGTDKKGEAPRVPYNVVIQRILKVIDRLDTDQYKIFVATDEQPFLDQMIGIFQDKVEWVKECSRSKDKIPLHNSRTGSRFLIGKYALIDCILLSKTNLLIRTSSNLSLISTYFNPELEVIELNQRRQ